MKTKKASLSLPASYPAFFSQLKKRIRQAQVKAALSVNRELVLLYWEIGKAIAERQKAEGWGAKVINHLSADLTREFPDMKGFSPTNLKYMRRFAEGYPDLQIGQQAVDQLPWGHNIVLLTKIDATTDRLWYAKQTIEHGWSRNVLVHQIESKLHKRQGKALSNFSKTLPPAQSDLAQELVKDPYNFDFLNLSSEAHEREIEKELAHHIQKFLLELGVGFAFVGRQYHLEVGDEDFYIDLLFYHLKLRCYVVIELKTGKFKPDYTGQLNFYLSVVDDMIKHPNDAPSIGIILCKDKNKLVAEYSLRDMNKPMGVSEYKLTSAIPKQLKGTLPTIKEIERELGGKK